MITSIAGFTGQLARTMAPNDDYVKEKNNKNLFWLFLVQHYKVIYKQVQFQV